MTIFSLVCHETSDLKPNRNKCEFKCDFKNGCLSSVKNNLAIIELFMKICHLRPSLAEKIASSVWFTLFVSSVVLFLLVSKQSYPIVSQVRDCCGFGRRIWRKYWRFGTLFLDKTNAHDYDEDVISRSQLFWDRNWSLG